MRQIAADEEHQKRTKSLVSLFSGHQWDTLSSNQIVKESVNMKAYTSQNSKSKLVSKIKVVTPAVTQAPRDSRSLRKHRLNCVSTNKSLKL